MNVGLKAIYLFYSIHKKVVCFVKYSMFISQLRPATLLGE